MKKEQINLTQEII